MRTRARFIVLLTTITLVLAIHPVRAGIGLPGIPNPQQFGKDLASKQIVKAMGDTFLQEQPVRVSLNDAFPTVAQLPGGRFHAAPQSTLEHLFLSAHDGRVRLPVGDYAVSVMTYCMNVHAHAPLRNTFHLAPIRGKWADIVAALNGRVGTRYSPLEVQVLSWSLQAGLKYSELSSRSRQIVDAVIPEYKPRMQQSFLETLQARWSQLSSTVPGVPSFDQALNNMGDVGKAIIEVRNARDTLITNANDYDRIASEFANIGKPRVSNGSATTPWSVIAPGVYARLRNKATFLSPGVLQIRVTAEAAAQPSQVAASNMRGIGADIAKGAGADVPIPSYAGAPTAAVQPLGMTPRPGSAPDPGEAGSSGGSPGGHDSSEDDSDTNSPCDPPGNMYGVDSGTFIDSSESGMHLGRGTGHGIVCLLLRAHINLAALGWPTRGIAEVDKGSVGYNISGHLDPGHVFVTVNYTYGMGIPSDPYAKKDVTVVIDYGDVTTYCPELTQTWNLHGDHLTWLSAAELENRMCITAMSGQTMHIITQLVDGTTVGPYSHAHLVDPQMILYSDASGHM